MPESRGGDISRGRPVGGRSDRAGLPGCADAWRTTAALGGVARPRGRSPHSRPAPASRTHRWRTPSRTPPRGSAPCATARLWRSRRPAAAPAQGEDATRRDGGDRPTGGSRRRRQSRGAAITRTRIPMPSRSHERETSGTNGCRWENLGARERGRAVQGLGRARQPAGDVPRRAPLRHGWHARAPVHNPRPGGRQPQREGATHGRCRAGAPRLHSETTCVKERLCTSASSSSGPTARWSKPERSPRGAP